MNFFRLGMTAVFAALVALDVASSARASVVFDNFAPANAFNGSNFFSIYGGSRNLDLHGEPLPDRDVAMPFIAAASGAVGTIDVAIEMLLTTGTNAFDLILLTDSGGHPGAAIESIHRAVTPGNPGVVSVDSLSHPILTAGQSYWLAASVDGMSEMSWFTNLIGDVGPVGVRDAPADWVLVDDPRGAFRVLSTTPIPEPSTLPLALLAAVTLAALTRSEGERKERGAFGGKARRLSTSHI